MATSTSSLFRHRPVVLVVTGAAAAFAAYYVYTILQSPPAGGLHRSNAVRRSPRRIRRRRQTPADHTDVQELIRYIQITVPQLGSFNFLGYSVALDVLPLPTISELRQIAGPEPSSDDVAAAIISFYETFIIRLLPIMFPNRQMLPDERHALELALRNIGLDPDIIPQAFRRYENAGVDPAWDQENNGRESIAGTEASWHTLQESGEDHITGDGQTLRRTLYHIAEERARQEGVKHRGVSCDQCDAKPIRGIRWRCVNCADFDLCSDCEATNTHTKTHIFYKIRIPAPYLGLPKQSPVYPGRPNMMSPSIDSALKRRLVNETSIEAEEIEALWDQFTCLADTEWRDDPNHIGWAIDRRSFNQAFIPRYSTFTSAPNLIYDRVFAYYDSNNDGKVGYEEFVKGLDGMHSCEPAVKLKIVFNGYDIDGDGYISRKDVLRLFRAYYAIEKEGTRNYIAESTDELSVAGALDVINSGQPLASHFQQASSVSTPRNRRLHAKIPDRYGDLRSPFHGAVLDDTDDTADREDVLGIASQPDNRRNPGSREMSDPPADLQDTVQERWRRRQFYIDEEEGLYEPEGHHEHEGFSDIEQPITADPSSHQDSNETHVPRGSRSSSRVHFQDNPDVETRSNASTSSRPVGERWGGYEIPEPEKDLGKELLYQITQQAFNELLNPLFLEKENLAMDAFDTKQARSEHRSEIESITATFEGEGHMRTNETIWYLGSHGYSRRMVELIIATGCTNFLQELKEGKHTITSARLELKMIVTCAEARLVASRQPSDDPYPLAAQKLWNVELWRLQFEHELSTTLLEMFAGCGWIKREEDCHIEKDAEKMNGGLKHPDNEHEKGSHSIAERPAESSSASERPTFRDPTLPQYHPNSQSSEPLHLQIPEPYQDPTLPQFRPNSLADIRPTPTVYMDMPESPVSSVPSQYTTPENYGSGSSSDTDDNTEFVYQMDKGPLFFFPESFIISASNKADYKQLPPPLPTNPDSIPTILDTPARETAKLNPALFSFSFDPLTLRLDAHPHVLEVPHNARQRVDITLALRRMAAKSTSPCYLARLANLEAVERETKQRPGSGLISYDEFMTLVLQDGKLRFLEAWMDWDSSPK